MTIKKFEELNNLFNSIISKNELSDVYGCLDGELIISRVYIVKRKTHKSLACVM